MQVYKHTYTNTRGHSHTIVRKGPGGGRGERWGAEGEEGRETALSLTQPACLHAHVDLLGIRHARHGHGAEVLQLIRHLVDVLLDEVLSADHCLAAGGQVFRKERGGGEGRRQLTLWPR